MAKNKVSEWNSNPASNTDVGGVDIAEGCAPSGINNAIREVMAQIKDLTTGADNDPLTVGGNLTVGSTLTANSSVGTAGQALLSRGAGLSPEWGAAFVTGMIMLWSGSIASIPSGWALCNGSSGTPDLRNRFVVGAGSTYAVNATGGSADAIVVSHTHDTTGNYNNNYLDRVEMSTSQNGGSQDVPEDGTFTGWITSGRNDGASRALRFQNKGFNSTALSLSTTTEGSSGTNANLPPYFALAYIMKL